MLNLIKEKLSSDPIKFSESQLKLKKVWKKYLKGILRTEKRIGPMRIIYLKRLEKINGFF